MRHALPKMHAQLPLDHVLQPLRAVLGERNAGQWLPRVAQRRRFNRAQPHRDLCDQHSPLASRPARRSRCSTAHACQACVAAKRRRRTRHSQSRHVCDTRCAKVCSAHRVQLLLHGTVPVTISRSCHSGSEAVAALERSKCGAKPQRANVCQHAMGRLWSTNAAHEHDDAVVAVAAVVVVGWVGVAVAALRATATHCGCARLQLSRTSRRTSSYERLY